MLAYALFEDRYTTFPTTPEMNDTLDHLRSIWPVTFNPETFSTTAAALVAESEVRRMFQATWAHGFWGRWPPTPRCARMKKKWIFLSKNI